MTQYLLGHLQALFRALVLHLDLLEGVGVILLEVLLAQAPELSEHLVDTRCFLYVLGLHVELREVINEQNDGVGAVVALAARATLDLHLLALLLREEGLDDVDASGLLHVLVATYEVRASAELPRREGQLSSVSGPLHQVFLLFILDLLIKDEAGIAVLGRFGRVKEIFELLVVLEEDDHRASALPGVEVRLDVVDD